MSTSERNPEVTSTDTATNPMQRRHYTTSYKEVRAAKAAGHTVTLSGRGGWYIEERA
jgi:hypothetical protein